MNNLKVLAVCIGLWGATAMPALAQHGGGFSGHAGGFSGHGGNSGGHASSSHYAGHGGYGGYGGGYHGGWGGRWHGGWGGGWVGGVYVNPWWYADAYPYYAYPDVAVAPAAPVYVQPSSPAVASQGTWYYCQNPAGYYPYVKNCNSGWQQVPAQPQGAQ